MKMRIDEKHLKSKGWPRDEIDRVLDVLEEAEQSKEEWIERTEANMHWLFLFLAVLGNLALATVLLPVMVVAPDAYLLPL
ncbi:MAG: hypothetical protein ABEI52_03835, partial [Halobacteriaceae archaeon]